MSTVLIVLFVWLVVGCGGGDGGTVVPSAAQTVQPPLAGEVLAGAGGAGVSAVRYCGTSGAGLTVTVEAAGAVDGVAVQAGIDGAVTDIAAVVAVPDNGAVPVVEWDPALSGRFLTMAVITPDGLELSLAGLRRSSTEEVNACVDPTELEALLADRWELTGDTGLCTVRWDGAAADEGTTSAAIDARRRASTLGQVDPVEAVEVRAVDGQYEVGWALKLTGDYNQDGEIGAMDLTPLGILYGLTATDSGWLSSAMERVDGNGDGAITSADISPVGQDYGNQCFDYRVEKSTGDADGPGVEWTTAAECGRSVVTQYGDAVTSTGSSPYQRVLDDAAPGWTWYRVVAIAGSGSEAEPSPAVLAPDITPPEWTGDPGLTIDDEYYFHFDSSAVDDRDEVEVALELRTDCDGSPDERTSIPEMNSRTSIEPIVDPYWVPDDYYYYESAEDEDPDIESIYYRSGMTYHARLKVYDLAGNYSTSGWVAFEGYWDRDLMGSIPTIGTVWVSKEGSVRFTPSITTDCGLGQILIHTFTTPRDEYDTDYRYLEDFAGADTQEYQGGEVLLEHAVSPGEILYLGVSVESLDESDRVEFDSCLVFYPHVWIKPFEVTEKRKRFNYEAFGYLIRTDPRMPVCIESDWDTSGFDEGYMHFLEGGTDILENISAIPVHKRHSPTDPFPAIHEVTGEVIFYEVNNSDFSVYWFKRQAGFSGHSPAPEGVFHRNLGNVDYVMNWVGLDEDSLAGIRCKPQDDGTGTYGFEVWEAPRDGEMIVREIVFPYEGLTENDQAAILDYRDGRYVLKLQLATGPALIGFYYDDYYAFQEEDGSWTVVYGEELPTVFDTAPWDKWRLEVYSPSTDTSYLHVYAYFEDEDENKTTYNGMYKGDLRDGLAGFELMYEFRSDELLDGQYSVPTNTYLYPLYPMDGSMFGEGLACSYILNPDGAVDVVHREIYNENFDELRCIWVEHDYRPVYANGLISDDGEWLAVGREGSWGLAYWRELPEM